MKFLLASSVSAELLRGLAHEKLKLEPGYAADLFINVEDQWINEASQLDGLKRVQVSCGQIATAIIQGSEGDESKVEEYLSTVCNQNVFARSAQWHKGLCQSFASHMTAYLERNDAEYNRNYLDTKKICTAFYQDISNVGEVEEKRRAAQAKADKEEAIKKKIEEERKKAEEKEKAKIAAAAKAKAAAAKPPKPRGGDLKKQVIKAHQQNVVAQKPPPRDKSRPPKDLGKPKGKGGLKHEVVAVAKPPKGKGGLKDKIVAVAKPPKGKGNDLGKPKGRGKDFGKPKGKGGPQERVVAVARSPPNKPKKPKKP